MDFASPVHVFWFKTVYICVLETKTETLSRKHVLAVLLSNLIIIV